MSERDGEVTDNTLLDGRVRLMQPAIGYRVAIDPVFLAAAVPAGPGDLVLDLGCGVGAASLCLAAREPNCRIVGIERDRTLVRLASTNIEANRMNGRVEAMVGDLLRLPPRLAPGSFAHVMANPPFLEGDAGTLSPQAAKADANHEGEAKLGDWIRCALVMVRPKGSVTFIYRADRIDRLMAELAGKIGELVVYPLWPGGDKPANRILVRGRKSVATPARLMPGMVLHGSDGGYTAAAEAVLRNGAGILL
ncbi:MAG: methyltransferase [Rhodospirillaceae bacterium]|nr:methyltransferase [Rhodospirillaceae bacterium]